MLEHLACQFHERKSTLFPMQAAAAWDVLGAHSSIMFIRLVTAIAPLREMYHRIVQ
jgi:hypothetical protein